MMETLVVILIVAVAAAWLGRRLWRMFARQSGGSCCSGKTGRSEKRVNLTVRGERR